VAEPARPGVRTGLAAARQRISSLPARGPFRPETWRSPVRGPWLTSVFGSVLLAGIPVMVVTGLVSYAAYDPRLPGNDTTATRGVLGFYLFNWVTSPSWIYRVSQGTHVVLGLALVPVVLAKLWSVIPKLFEWPALRSVAHALERLSLALLVGGAIFEFVTGIADIEYYYPWKFSFYDAHLYGAWVFGSAFVVHVVLKAPTMWRALRSRSLRAEMGTPLAATRPEEGEGHGLIPAAPGAPTISRRGLLGLVFGSSGAVFLLTAGQTLRPIRSLALLSPRARSKPTGAAGGANDFEINRTFVASGIAPAGTGAPWRLQLEGRSSRSLTRDELLALPQTTRELPIACVEGWSTVQRWTGVRLADLSGLVGVDTPGSLYVESLERPGEPFRSATLAGNQVSDPGGLLALRVNGADLSLDHGYPARIVVPGAPGVHCTKWVARLAFRP
jgi:DMSO/TMAO reductase YedYZ molybdopterin-dependent catalytic subunit